MRTSSPVAFRTTNHNPVPAKRYSPIPVINARTVALLTKKTGRHCFLEARRSDKITPPSRIKRLYPRVSAVVFDRIVRELVEKIV